jgi:membrane protease subunit HflC
MRLLIIVLALIAVSVVGFNLSFFVVDETQLALIQQFGEIVKEIKEPGLYSLVPFTQNVIYLDKRILIYEIRSRSLITGDRKTLEIDNYALWQIENPKAFIENFGGGISDAQRKLDDWLYSNLRNVLAKQPFEDIVSGKREKFLQEVTRLTALQAQSAGIRIIDVRIRRADLPQANEQAVFQRMQTERQREAALFRAEGDQQARNIRSQADKDQQITLAEARQKAEQLKGEGDAQALEIYANAASQDPEFYRFWRTLESYRRSFKEGDTIVLSTESDYFSYFEKITPKSENNK